MKIGLLQMSITGAVMILVLLLIRPWAIYRMPKKYFLIFWDIVLLRLIIPFSFPYFIYIKKEIAEETVLPVRDFSSFLGDPAEISFIEVSAKQPSFSIWAVLWGIGFLAVSLFFITAYIKCIREFQTSLPMKDAFIEQWLADHPLKRHISIRQSDRTFTPLTYGIIHPVILVPKSVKYIKIEILQYILTHEYIHIQRWDALIKLVLTGVLCIHWFNPFVWVMYFIANRDIELSCDEAVIYSFGESQKSDYALALIEMEEIKSKLIPLYSSFSKNVIEERIVSIMKIKRATYRMGLLVLILAIGLTTAFGILSVKAEENLQAIPNTGFTDEEYGKLLELAFEGYENMTVLEFQEKVWTRTDTEEYRDLLERFSKDPNLYMMKDQNETASFLYYILEPLTAEKWQKRDFSGYVVTRYALPSEEAAAQASLEYILILHILDPQKLTVKEYNAARLETEKYMVDLLQSQTLEDLRNASAMKDKVEAGIADFIKKKGTQALQFEIEYAFFPPENLLSEPQEEIEEKREARIYPNGTKEDYKEILALKTADYKKMTIENFNQDLLDCVNQLDYERFQSVLEDTVHQGFPEGLTPEEKDFLTFTFYLSNRENACKVRSIQKNRPEEDPTYGGVRFDKDSGDGAWCTLWYQFAYHIPDKKKLTIGERDRHIKGFMQAMERFWSGASLEKLLTKTEKEIVSDIQKIAEQYSSKSLTILIDGDQVQFEHMDERAFYL